MAIAGGSTVAEASRRIGVTEQTFYRRRSEYGGLRIDQARRLKRLESENGSRSDTRQPDTEGGCGGKLLSSARRRCVNHVKETLGVSERRALQGVGPSSVDRTLCAETCGR